jgi:drug/metabolite transporter (DMT)-like permease
MSLTVFLAVLGAAAMHAVWNALIKVRLDRFLSISLMTIGMGVASLPALPLVDLPQGKVWFWILLSTAIHTFYRLFLIRAYETGDLAQAYPLARGAAPLMTTIGGVVLIGEFPTPLAVAGIVCLCTGTLLMSLRGGARLGVFDRRAVGFALITSVCVAGYTLTDGSGARLAATASSYAAWLFTVDAVWTLALCFFLRGRGVLSAMLPEWKIGIVTGLLGGAAYWIAMWAMTRAPIASVAALRETSILFALMISVFALREAVTRWRIAAVLFIVAGVVALRLG